MTILVTGSSGLIGSEAVAYFAGLGERVVGVDNNMRREFFGPDGDTAWNLSRLTSTYPSFVHHDQDIRDRAAILELFRRERPSAVIHCAAQPSHDLAAQRPFDDFDVNAVGTLNLLGATRCVAPDAPFIFMSTNKVYGDAPNELPLVELERRWDYACQDHRQGIDESMRIDQSKHSLFGASKVAADVLVQEYGRYFGMATVCFRGGCLTGPHHSGAEPHGFLSYLAKAVAEGRQFRIYGYKGKQVRDQIHSDDVVRAFASFIEHPRCAAVYNLGGGRENSVSILEAIAAFERIMHRSLDWEYVDRNREGDHICYLTDLGQLRRDYPDWRIEHSLEDILQELAEHSSARLARQQR